MKQPTHAGALVYRCSQGVVRYALVSASDDPTTWVLPKGHIETDETPEQTAVREVREEAGIEARVVSDLGVVRFTRKGLDIRIQFFLMVYEASVPAYERRSVTWAVFDEAQRLLTHADALDLLASAQRAVVASLAASTSSEAAQALLIRDYDSLTQALASNEAVGDTRLNFFIGLVTAVVSGLVALSLSESERATLLRDPVTLLGGISLLMLGIVILFRIIHRNSVTDGYRRDLDRIRAIYREQLDTSGMLLSHQPHAVWSTESPDKQRLKLRRFGGLADTVAVINALILAGLLTLPPISWSGSNVAIASMALFVVQIAYVRYRDYSGKKG